MPDIHVIRVKGDEVRPARTDTAIIEWTGDPYEGPYTIEPSGEQQIFATANKRFRENLVVQPIPQNYGRVSWNGSYLTIE